VQAICLLSLLLAMSNKPWFVYLLLCDQKTFYVGMTNDLENRLIEHKTKQSFFTKKFSEIELTYCEQYKFEHEAATREKQLKGWSRAKKQMLIYGKLGLNSCTDFAKALLVGESHVSLW
jgi:putative endonuclease